MSKLCVETNNLCFTPRLPEDVSLHLLNWIKVAPLDEYNFYYQRGAVDGARKAIV
jgi:hypothetical protein